MELLRSYSPRGAAGFITYSLRKDTEDRLWELWLQNGEGGNFEDYVKKAYRESGIKDRAEPLTKEEEKKRLEFAATFVKTKKGKNE
jgi:hypothetical protein